MTTSQVKDIVSNGRSARLSNSDAMTQKELEIVRAEIAKSEFQVSPKEKCYSWVVLIMLLGA